MLISQLIKELEEERDKHGDITVCVGPLKAAANPEYVQTAYTEVGLMQPILFLWSHNQ